MYCLQEKNWTFKLKQFLFINFSEKKYIIDGQTSGHYCSVKGLEKAILEDF